MFATRSLFSFFHFHFQGNLNRSVDLKYIAVFFLLFTLLRMYFSHCRLFQFCLFVSFVSIHFEYWRTCKTRIHRQFVALTCSFPWIWEWNSEGYNLRAVLVKWSIMCFDDPEPTQLLNGYALHLHWKMWHSQKCHNILNETKET